VLLTALSCFLFAVAGLLAIPVAVLCVQVCSAAAPRGAREIPMSVGRPSLAVLMPAHDEAADIGATCEAIRDQLAADDRLVVIADNCTDQTAQLARTAGAEVVERFDRSNVGKGYALDFGMKYLADNPPVVVVVVDADCTLAAGTLDRLARVCAKTRRPVQAVYSMRTHARPNFRLRIAEFAAIVKNLVRPLGYQKLGLPCMLMGTGMALPWSAVVRADFATGHIVEDMKLGIDLASVGFPPLLSTESEVVSYFPDSVQGFAIQRTRWEHGHLSLVLEVPRLIARAIRLRNGSLLAMALDLAVPPLALLALVITATVAASTIPAVLHGEIGPLLLSAALLLLLCMAIAIAWARFARSIITFTELAFAPLYALAKIPMYLRFIHRKQVDWVRSARDRDEP
jgi:cellulose synthase/poly-beta-1,6-N-acetylglucosamine synthase-like glycosyltransferase